MRQFDVELREVERDDGCGYFVVSLTELDADTGEVLLSKESDVFDNLSDAMDAFAKLQHDWYFELNADIRFDVWRVRMDVTL